MKKVGDMNQGGSGKNVVDEGFYKFVVTAFKVVLGASGHPYVVVGAKTVEGPEPGQNIELGFSLSPNAEGICYAWLVALGFKDTDDIENNDPDLLKSQLNKIGMSAALEADLEETKNKAGYAQNGVTPPWEIHAAEDISKEDIAKVNSASKEAAGDDKDLPDWAK